MKNDFRLTKEEFLKLYDDSISKKEYKDTLNKISNRINYMLREIMSTQLEWWDFYGSGDFNPEIYKLDDTITVEGEFVIPEPYEYSDFPIRWLWEDFEDEFKSDVETHKRQKELEKQKAKEKREKLKIKKAEMKETISAKLTEEELKFIKFK